MTPDHFAGTLLVRDQGELWMPWQRLIFRVRRPSLELPLEWNANGTRQLHDGARPAGIVEEIRVKDVVIRPCYGGHSLRQRLASFRAFCFHDGNSSIQ